MGFGSLIRSAVATAHRLTGGTDGLQVEVTFAPWIGTDSDGQPEYDSDDDLPAIVEMLSGVTRSALMRTATGEETVARAKILLLALPKANGADGRAEPIDPRDQFTLPDGSTGPILSIGGVLDPDTDAPYAAEVTIG